MAEKKRVIDLLEESSPGIKQIIVSELKEEAEAADNDKKNTKATDAEAQRIIDAIM